MPNARPRARRSRYRYGVRLGRSAPAVIAAVFLLGVLLGASLAVARTLDFLHRVVNFNNPITIVQHELDPPAGSIAWKLRNGQPVTILVMGYGGAENDAPWLTDTMMVITVDPRTKRVLEASIPRDLYVRIDAWQDGRTYTEKINTAFEVGNDQAPFAPGPLKPAYQGKDGAGHLAEDTVTMVTGIRFDRYLAVDFKAFRDTVDALGGVSVHLDSPLDDCHYPDYHDGYVNHGVPPGYPCPPGSGIHFPAGDYQVNGEQALEIARSREAIEPDQATDFGRAKRQQMIVQAIRKKAESANGLLKAPQLMDALQNDFKTDLDLNDLKALYDFGAALPDTSITRLALTDSDLLRSFYRQPGSCGPAFEYVLCPQDGSYRYLHHYFEPQNTLLDPAVLAEKAPLQILNGIAGNEDVDDRVTASMRGLGLNLADALAISYPAAQRTVIYDYSGGAYAKTAAWLSAYFYGAPVVPAVAPAPGAPGSPPVIRGEDTQGLVVVLGRDFYLKWLGLTP